jgi:hypothetical protein
MNDTLRRTVTGRTPNLRVLQEDGPADEPDSYDVAGEQRPPDDVDRARVEAFWSGRNHAMRRSARVAA